jgi:hypothetical protein
MATINNFTQAGIANLPAIGANYLNISNINEKLIQITTTHQPTKKEIEQEFVIMIFEKTAKQDNEKTFMEQYIERILNKKTLNTCYSLHSTNLWSEQYDEQRCSNIKNQKNVAA